MREVWHCLLRAVGLQQLTPQQNATLSEWWQQTRQALPSTFRRCFDSLVLLTLWMLWKERNRRVFEAMSRTPHQLFLLIKEEADAWIGAGFNSLSALFAHVA